MWKRSQKSPERRIESQEPSNHVLLEYSVRPRPDSRSCYSLVVRKDNLRQYQTSAWVASLSTSIERVTRMTTFRIRRTARADHSRPHTSAFHSCLNLRVGLHSRSSVQLLPAKIFLCPCSGISRMRPSSPSSSELITPLAKPPPPLITPIIA